jgi:hypothetical protein
MNIENEGESHDVVDNKGRNFLPHDVADNTGIYRDYPTMFMKTNQVSFDCYSLDRAKAGSCKPGAPLIAPKRKTNPRSVLESAKVTKNEPENEPERT